MEVRPEEKVNIEPREHRHKAGRWLSTKRAHCPCRGHRSVPTIFNGWLTVKKLQLQGIGCL